MTFGPCTRMGWGVHKSIIVHANADAKADSIVFDSRYALSRTVEHHPPFSQGRSGLPCDFDADLW